MRYAQLVMGPAGSGKSTYCATILQHCKAIGRNVYVINLDPAAEYFEYDVIADIRDLVSLDDVTEDEELGLGPNGGLIYCLQYLIENLDWLGQKLGSVEDDYFLFDCPGQIELYTHLPVIRILVEQLTSWDIRTCGIFLLDAHYMNETTKFFSGALVALSAMITLEIPHINLVTKMDLLNDEDKSTVQRFLDMDTDLLKEVEDEPWLRRHLKLTNAISALFEDYNYVSFLPFDQTDEENINDILMTIDNSIQYGEDLEHKEGPELQDNNEENQPFDHGGVAAVDDYIYVVGGKNGNKALDSVERFDPRTNKWEHMASLKVPMYDSAVVALKDFLYKFGGNCNGKKSNSTSRYDPSTDSWSDLIEMSTPRSGCSACVAPSQRIIVVGGLSQNGATLDRVESYDPILNTWTVLASLKLPRRYAGIASLDGMIFIFGGFFKDSLAEIESYDEKLNEWTMLEKKLPKAINGISCAVMRLKK